MKNKRRTRKGGGPDSVDRRQRITMKRQIARTPFRDAVDRFGQKLTSLVYKKLTVYPTPYMNGRTSIVLDISHALGRRVIKMMVLTETKMPLKYFPGINKQKFTVTKDEFETEFVFLQRLSAIGLCPKPYIHKIYPYNPTTLLPPILEDIRKEIVKKRLSVVGKALDNFFKSMKFIHDQNPNIQYGLIDMKKIYGPSLYYMIHGDDEIDEIDEIDETLACDIYSLVLVLYMKGYSNYDCNERNILLPPRSYPMMIDTAEVEMRSEGFQEDNDKFESYITHTLTERLQSIYSHFGEQYEESFIRKFLEKNDEISCEGLTQAQIVSMLDCIENSSPFYHWMGSSKLQKYKGSPLLIHRLRARYNNEPYT